MMHCDKQGVVQAWYKLGSCSAGVLELMRRIPTVAANGHFAICIMHIPGCQNDIADALSQFQMVCFRLLAPKTKVEQEKVPLILEKLFADPNLWLS